MSWRHIKKDFKILYAFIKSLIPSHCRLELLVLQLNNKLDEVIILLKEIAFIFFIF